MSTLLLSRLTVKVSETVMEIGLFPEISTKAKLLLKYNPVIETSPDTGKVELLLRVTEPLISMYPPETSTIA